MANSTHPVTRSAKASYTLDDAIAHLLGLLKRGLVKSEIKVTLSGVAQEDLREISTLPSTLNEHLIALMNAALSEGNTEEVARIDQLLNDADIYMQYLTDEIAKGPGSAIRIDQDATQETGVRHYTLKSIDDWFSANKSALDAATNTMAAKPAEVPLTEKSLGTLHLTIALLCERLAKDATSKNKFLTGEKPNHSAIARELENAAVKINGLSAATFVKVIRDSFKTLSSLSK